MLVRLVLLALLGWSATVAAQSQLGSLYGTVREAGGTGMPGASVALSGAELKRPRGANTDEDGRYRLGNLAPGRYALQVSYIGYRTIEKKVWVRPGENVELDFTLDPTVIFLEQNVVSASRTEEKVLEAPASVSIVEKEDIKPAMTVSHHLKDLPGVDFAQTGLAQSSAVTRGFNNVFSGAMLTLTDNRIARVPSLRLNAYNFIPVVNDDIERIEVVLGPGSALYGPNSANGVMHIITRSPLNSAGTSVSIGGGERALGKVSLRHAGNVREVFGYKVSAQYYQGTDWKFNDPAEIQARDFDIERRSAEVRFDYRPNQDLTAILTGGHNSSSNIEMTGLGAGQAIDWQYNYAQARLLYRDWFAQVSRNWSDAGDTFLLRTGNPIIDKSSLTVFQLQHSTYIGTRQRFIYGGDLLLTRPDTEGTVTGRNENNDDINESGLYLQSETELLPQLDLVLALRYDDHNRIAGGELSPRGALVYKPRQDQILRLTYNRAFSTPSTNNLYLDLKSARDPFGLEAFGVSTIDISTQGSFRAGFENGFTFRRDAATGRPQFRSVFAPAFGLAIDEYINLDDPIFTNVMWGAGRSAVLSQLTGQFEQVVAGQLGQQLAAAGVDDAAAVAQAQAQALAQALPAVIPQQLTGLKNTLAEFNLERQGNPDAPAFLPVTDVKDVTLTQPTITQTFEVGYKGIIGKKLVIAADFYRTKTENFVGPLAVETPNVFLEAGSLGQALAPALAQNLALPENAALAQAVDGLDDLPPGLVEGLAGNGDGSGIDELTNLLAGGVAQIPFGTVTPEQAYETNDVILTYRNFGEVTLNGLDLNLAYYPTDEIRLSGNYSYVSDNFFANLDGIGDIALNAPQHKAKFAAQIRLPEPGLLLGGQVRYNDAFPMNSGVYVGTVESFTVLDLHLSYDLPVRYDLQLRLKADNILDNRHREFVGAPEIGRLVYTELGVYF
jgi:outer membrane receptor for ferrienterochelin and colicins